MRDHGETGFKYRKPDAKAVHERSTQRGGDFVPKLKEGFREYRAVAGKNKVRFLPATWDGARHFGYDVWIHFGIGGEKQSFICPAKQKKGPCPICEAINNADASDAADMKSIAAKRRVAYFVLDRKGEEPERPLVWFAPWTVDKDMTGRMQTEDGEMMEVDNPDEGFDFMYTRTGEGMTTKYEQAEFSRKVSPISDDRDVWKKVLNTIVKNPIPTILHVEEYDAISEVFNGVAAKPKDEDESSDDDEPRKPNKAAAALDEDEDEKPSKRREIDEDDERPSRTRNDESDDDEEEKPKKPTRREIDEDDEPAPPKKSKDAPKPSAREAARKAMEEDDE